MKMMKRVLSLVLCMVMLVGMLPMEALAVTPGEDGVPVYGIGESVWVRGEEAEPVEISAPDTFWLPDYDDNDQPVTRQGLCEKTEHTHTFACPEGCELAHQHGEDCYVSEYTGCVLHTHDETCVTETVYDCGKEQHENHDGCTASQVCPQKEHDHAALNCGTEVRFTCETEEHTHSTASGCPYKTVFTCTEEHEHSEENGCAQETRCVCAKAEHTHSVEAGCANETVYTCGKENHTHSESCTLTSVYDCGKEIHVHDETCPTKQVYPNCAEHAEHNENCKAEQKLNCGKAEHTCITEGCAADCAIEEHTHTADCDMEGVYYKWTVVEDTSSTLESGRALPVHFFIAEPGEAIDPDGAYVNYRTDLWGDPDNASSGIYSIPGAEDMSTIKSKNGIRNVGDEGLITPYIANYSQYANELKNFGSITINRVTYSQSEYEIKWVTTCFRQGYRGGVSYACNCRNFVNNDGEYYDHIHVDGVLSKKITPAEMKLTKTIPAAQNSAENFNFRLTKLQHDSNGNPTSSVDTNFGTNGSINLLAAIAANSTSASIVSPTGMEIGFGFYKLTEIVETNSRWQTKAIKIKYSNNNTQTAPTDDIYIQIGTDGTFRFCGTLNGEYAKAQEIIIENERKPLDVTYTWEGIPAGLATLPEGSTVAPGGSHTINTSYPVGARVRGIKGVIDKTDNTDSEGYYYEFLGWQYYDRVSGNRTYIQYAGGNPGQITDIDSNVNVHGLWVRHELDRADGYITITKTFKNKPTGDVLNNFYIAVIHDDHETEISPNLVGTWNADGTRWTYDFAISESSNYKIVEGKYDVAGYTATTDSAFTNVAGISTGKAFTGSQYVSDGHSYTELGQEITVNLPYDTSTLEGVEGRADDLLFYAGTVAFTNEYTRQEQNGDPVYPSFQVRKWDANYANRLTGATFKLTKTDTNTVVAGVEKDATTVFENLQPGQYTLIEETAPEGYIKTDAVYNFTVELDTENEIEELRPVCTNGESHAHTTECYVFVKTQVYKIVLDGYGNEGFVGRYNPDLYRLNIPNTQIRADLTLTKSFKVGNNALDLNAGSVLVDVYGPVTWDGNHNLTGVGSLLYSGLAITPDADGNWDLTLTDLPYGEYFVEEIMASVHGYNWTDVDYRQGSAQLEERTVNGHKGVVVAINDANAVTVNITNTYEEWSSADFYILKTDLSGNELQGAKFQLFDGTTDVTSTYVDGSNVTDVNGLVHFSNFEVDKGETLELTLKETQAPNGYYLTSEEYKVIVDHDDNGYEIKVINADGSATGDWDANNAVLTVINTPILGEITVNKSLKFNNQLFNTVPDGTYVTFQLENVDGTYIRNASLTKDTGWSHTFTDLPLGTYTIKEIYATIDGHTYVTKINGLDDADAAATVTLTVGNNHLESAGQPTSASAAVNFENTYTRVQHLHVTPTDFTILKQGENGEALSGATFALFTDEACTNKLTAPVAGFTVEKTTDAYGQAHFSGLKLADLEYAGYINTGARSATYYLKETVAPANHVLNDTVWKITISEDKIKVDTLNDDKTAFDTVVNWITGIFKPNTDGTYTAISGNLLTVENKRIKGTLTVNKTFGDNVPPSALTDARVEVHVHGPITRDASNNITDIGPLVKNINLTNGNWNDVVSNLEVGEYVLREPFASIHGYSWTDVVYYENEQALAETKFNGNDFVVFKVEAGNTNHSIRVHNTYEEWAAADFYVNKVKSLTNLNDGLSGATFKLYTDAACTIPAVSTTENSITVEATTGIAGYVQFKGFKEATVYYLKETVAPDNYKQVPTVWKVEIKAVTDRDTNKTTYEPKITLLNDSSVESVADKWSWNPVNDVLNVVNEEILGSITITKNFVNQPKDANGNDLPAKIEVRVIGPNGYDETVELKPSTDADKNWTATLSGLHMGTYYVTEGDANVPGYTLTTTGYAVSYNGSSSVDNATQPSGSYATVELSEGTNRVNPDVEAAVVITNTYTRNEMLKVSKASFQIKKVDAEDPTKVLENAKFGLFVGNALVKEVTTDANGIAEFKDIPLINPEDEKSFDDYTNATQEQTVTYYLRETDAPAGYAKTDTAWVVTLTEDIAKVNTLNADKNVFETVVDWIINGFKPNGNGEDALVNGTLTVPNQRIKGKISLSKSFAFKDSQEQPVTIATDRMDNVKVELHVHGPVVWKDSTKTEIVSVGEGRPIVLDGKNITSAGAITAELDNLPLGDYLIHETRISIHGYTWVGADFKVNGSAPTVITHDGHQYVRVEVTENTATETASDVNITCQNTYEAWDSVDFYIYKTDENGRELAGATFGLFELENNQYTPVKDGNQNVVKETGSDGLAHFVGLTVPNGVDSVTYYVKETNAPVGYHKNESVWKVTVKTSQGSYDLEIDDLSDNDGTDESVDNATDTITVVNREIKATLTIRKEIEGDGLPAGTFVKPADQNGTGNTGTSADEAKRPKIVVNVTGPGYNQNHELSYENGKMELILTDLPLGTYTVTEVTANAKVPGYDLIQTTYQVGTQAANTVTFTDDRTSTATGLFNKEIVITNTYDKREGVVNNPDQFTIHKKDDAGKDLPGAKFRLTNDRNTAFVREFVTGEDGKVVVDNLIGVGELDSYANVTYTLEEIAAPTGHELAEKRTWTIKVVEDGPENTPEGNVAVYVVLNEQNNTWETIWDWINNEVIHVGAAKTEWNNETKTLTVENKRKKAEISVTKTVSGLPATSDDAFIKNLLDAEYKFELYIGDTATAAETITITTDELGEKQVFTTKVPFGSKYKVKEVVTDQDAFVSTLSDNAEGSVGIDELAGVTVEATNTYKIQDVTPLTLDFIKVSTGRTATPLSGAKFELYDGNDNRMKSYTTGKDGKFKITEITEPGAYELIETAAPSGYYKLKKAIVITVSYDYQVVENANGDPEIAKRLVATVAGSTSYQVSDNNDFYYGIKNTPITEVSDTGDEAELLFWGGMTTLSLLCMAIMLFVPRKKGKYQQ